MPPWTSDGQCLRLWDQQGVGNEAAPGLGQRAGDRLVETTMRKWWGLWED